MANHFNGEVNLQLEGKSLLLKFDWDSIGKIQSEISEDFGGELARATMEFDMPVLSKYLAIGLELHHPGLYTAEAIMKLSPAIAPIITGLRQAMTATLYGSLEVPGDQGKNPLRTLLRVLKMMTWGWWRGRFKGAASMA